MFKKKGRNNQNTPVPSSSQAKLSTAVSAMTETAGLSQAWPGPAQEGQEEIPTSLGS